MSKGAPTLAAIDAAIAKGEWWITLFEALSDAGMKQVEALKVTKGANVARLAQVFCRLAAAVRLAIVVATRLDEILRGLADLRRIAPRAVAAIEARTRPRTEARDNAAAGHEPTPGETQEGETPDREEPDLRDRDPVVEALDRELAVDPVLTDIDALPLREAVERICTALGVTPDWSRWEAGDWTMGDPPARPYHRPEPADVPHHPDDPKASPATTPAIRRAAPPTTDTAIARILAGGAGPNAPPWPPPWLE